MKMTGYYLFSQALSVAMFESSIVIAISGVEPALKPHSFFPGFMVQSPHQPKEARDESGKALRKIGSGGGGHIAAGEGR
ncbi:MAG: hypothetical protein IKI42_10005 [Clostridia bacterium]|nr:hypothetical protein [Clostridia bacterium]